MEFRFINLDEHARIQGYSAADRRAVTPGAKVKFTCNGRGRGGHYNVTAVVTQVRAKSFDVIEAERSYRPGTNWRISFNLSDDETVYIYRESARCDVGENISNVH